MKKYLFSCIVFLSCATFLQAQDLEFGAKAGVNFANLGGDFEGSTTRTTFHVGGMVEIPLLDRLSLQPELLFTNMGAKDEEISDDVVRLSYLAVPVIAKYYLIDGLSVEAGPQIGFLLNSEVEEDGETEDISDITKSTDFGFNLGLGYKLESGLNFSGRYYFGGNISSVDDDVKVTNSVIMLSVGYFF